MVGITDCETYRTNWDPISIPRLRVGIGANFSKGRQADFVLSPWNPDEKRMLPTIVDRATKAVVDFATQGLEKTMNLHNGQIN